MLRLLADENFNNDIVRGLLRRKPDLDIGQALRYVGWVKKHLAKEGQSVEALIIARTVDKSAHYALSTVPNVRMMTYELEFQLRELEPLNG